MFLISLLVILIRWEWIYGNVCNRICEGKVKTCVYHFNLTMSKTLEEESCGKCPSNTKDCYKPNCIVGDGSDRPVFLVNRMFPGPEIDVCENDTVIVHVKNDLLNNEAITLHWHGIFQKGTQYADGVPMVTQCPILPHTHWTYRWKATPPGTKFWHAHTAFHRVDGIVGSLIVRPHSKSIESKHTRKSSHHKYGGKHHSGQQYISGTHVDLPPWRNEHIALIQEWKPDLAPIHFIRDDDSAPSLIINGRQGRFPLSPPAYFIVNESDIQLSTQALNVQTYFAILPLFKFINSGFLFCPFEIAIQDHLIIPVAADGSALVTPYKAVDIISMFAGDRFDVRILRKPLANINVNPFEGLIDLPQTLNNGDAENANGLNIPKDIFNGKIYQINVWSSGDCKLETYVANATAYIFYVPNGDNFTNENAEDIIDKYIFKADSNDNDLFIQNSQQMKTIYNPVHKDDFENNSNYIHLLQSPSSTGIPSTLRRTPDYKQYIYMDDFNIIDDMPKFNNITFMTPSSPLISQYHDIKSSAFCNIDSRPECNRRVCQCLHLLKIPKNSLVELIFVDQAFNGDPDIHSLHLHGYAFWILGQEKLNNTISVDYVKELDKKSMLKRLWDKAVIKDTVSLPKGGYAIIRFVADNPGFWMFHCHLDFHHQKGMALLFQVGEQKDLPPIPYKFPKCGNYNH